MKNYLISIIIASVAMGICEIITPKHNGVEKYVKLVGVLIILCAVISPISDTINTIDENLVDKLREEINNLDKSEDDYNDILKDYLANYSIAEAKTHIKNTLYEEFGISNDECDIKIYTDTLDGKVCINNIQILLGGTSIFKNPYTIEEYIMKL